jgi:hypothetical protein
MYREIFLADPTPFMFAYLAYHVRTTAFFLNLYTAILALPHILRVRVRPFIIAFINFLFTGFPWVPKVKAFEAVCLMTLTAH